jgi:hypothetical protein
VICLILALEGITLDIYSYGTRHTFYFMQTSTVIAIYPINSS